MKEVVINFNFSYLPELLGVNDSKLKIIQNHYPESKITIRDSTIKISGESKEVNIIQAKVQQLIDCLTKHQDLTEAVIYQVLQGSYSPQAEENNKNDVILYGNDNQVIRARTPNQKRLLKSAEVNDVIFATGPAGTGKTFTSVAIAVRALKNKEVKRIILTRPAVEAGENLGFLPGDMKEKIDPYLKPLFDALNEMIPFDKLTNYLERNVIEIAPLAFMRGRTLDNAYVILDEAQNCTKLQIKMFLTRMGPMAKFIITGDLTQIDLPYSQKSGLQNAIDILYHISGIEVIEFDVGDVCRHKLVREIVNAYSNDNINEHEKI